MAYRPLIFCRLEYARHISLSVCLRGCLSVSVCVCLSVCGSVCLCVCLSASLYYYSLFT